MTTTFFRFFRRRSIWWLPIKVVSLGSRIVNPKVDTCVYSEVRHQVLELPPLSLLPDRRFVLGLGGRDFLGVPLAAGRDGLSLRYPRISVMVCMLIPFGRLDWHFHFSFFGGRKGVCSVQRAPKLLRDLTFPFSRFYVLSLSEDCRIWTRH
jgi:hypothetical protein